MRHREQFSTDIIEACLTMNKVGLNHGTAGNISCRFQEGMLVTPSGVAYEKMAPEDIVFVDSNGQIEKDKTPSSEWRFHHQIYRTRPDLNAAIHNHAHYSTAVSVLNKDIPAIHYMIAAAGGNTIPCVPYATYGTPELSKHVARGILHRNAILLQHHGMIASGVSLDKALHLAEEVESLARIYIDLLQTGLEIPVIPAQEINVVLEKFKRYGLKDLSDN